jgi:hypothetical protein
MAHNLTVERLFFIQFEAFVHFRAEVLLKNI